MSRRSIRLPLMACVCAALGLPTAASAAESDSPSAAMSANERLEQLAQGKDAELAGQYVQAEAAFQQARALYAQARFIEAREQVEEAIRIFPGHEGAQELRRDVLAVLSSRQDRLEALTTWSRTLKDVAMQEQAVRIANLLEQADAQMEAGEYDDAFANYDRVAIAIRTFNYDFDWGELPEEVQEKRAAAAAAAREADLARRERARENAQQREIEIARLEENALRTKVNEILRRARNAYERKDFRRASVLAWNAYELDRRREDARDLYLAARRKQHHQMDRYLTEEREERLARVNEQIHQTLIPQTDLLEFPEDWFIRSQRKPAALGEQTEEAWMQVLNDRLEEEVTVDFEETPLEDAIDFLRRTTGVNFVISADVFASDQVPLISLRANNMKLKTALKWILQVTRLNMAIRNEAIFISTDEVRGDVVLRMYDISDIIKPIRDFPGLELSFQTANEAGGGFDFIEPAADFDAPDPADIEDFIRMSVASETWDQLPGVAIQYRTGSLFVSHSPEVHDQVINLLNNLRNQRSLQVNMQIRMLDVRKGFFEEIGVNITKTNDFDTPDADQTRVDNGIDPQARHQTTDTELTYGTNSVLPPRMSQNGFDPNEVGAVYNFALGDSDDNVKFILAAAESENDSQVLDAPEVTCYSGQRANAAFIQQVAYISDYEVAAGTDGGGILDPVISVLNHGSIIDVQPVVSSDRKYITLEVRPTQAVLLRSDPATIVAINNIGGGNGGGGNGGLFATVLSLPLELPVVEMRTLRSTVIIPDKGSLLLGSYTTGLRQRSRAGVPFLMHIPFLGRLFGRNGVYDDNRKLHYLLTGTIIDIPEWEEQQ